MINKEAAKANFELACAQYESAKDIVKELSTLAQRVSPTFSYEIAMRQFDVVLQAFLLLTASADGYFLDEEVAFIEKITDYGDLMALLNGDNTNVEWSNFVDFSAEELQEISVKILAKLDDLINNFIFPFAVIDKATRYDYCDDLSKKIIMICFALAGCDGDAPDSEDFQKEATLSFAFIQKVFVEKWNAIMENE